MKKFLLVALVVALVVFIGCVSVDKNIKEIPKVELELCFIDDQSSYTIHIYSTERRASSHFEQVYLDVKTGTKTNIGVAFVSNWSDFDANIYLDNKYIGTLPSGNYLSVEIPTGEHHVLYIWRPIK